MRPLIPCGQADTASTSTRRRPRRAWASTCPVAASRPPLKLRLRLPPVQRPRPLPAGRPPAAAALRGVIAAAAWGDAGSGARPAGAQETVAVAVGDFFFCDPSLPPGACQTVVSVGDTIAWEYRT